MDRPLHVGLVCSHWHPRPGGVERHTRDLARALVRRGHTVSVLCTGEDAAPGRALEEYVEGVLVRRWTPELGASAPGGSVLELSCPAGADRAARRWLHERAPDIVHVHHLSGLGTRLLDVFRSAGVPLALTLHDYWHLCPRGQMWSVDAEVCSEPVAEICASCQAATWPQLAGGASGADGARERIRTELEALAGVDRLIAPSTAVADSFLRAGLAQPIRVVPNGVEADELRARVRRLSPDVEPAARLGVLGSVQPSKGVLELARIVAGIGEGALTLDVHGSLEPYHGDASYARALRELASVEPRIRIHGPFAPEGLADVLAALDALAVPSLFEEPFGLAAREALAVGLPVFASDRGGLTGLEREAPGRCVVIPARDREAWAEVLTAFARGAGPRRDGGDARSVDEQTDALLVLYAELTGDAAAAASQAS